MRRWWAKRPWCSCGKHRLKLGAGLCAACERALSKKMSQIQATQAGFRDAMMI